MVSYRFKLYVVFLLYVNLYKLLEIKRFSLFSMVVFVCNVKEGEVGEF